MFVTFLRWHSHSRLENSSLLDDSFLDVPCGLVPRGPNVSCLTQDVSSHRFCTESCGLTFHS